MKSIEDKLKELSPDRQEAVKERLDELVDEVIEEPNKENKE